MPALEDFGLLARHGAARDPCVEPVTEYRDRLRLHLPDREAVQASDLQRAEFCPAQLAEPAVCDPEQFGCRAGERELVERVEEQVLREVALRDRALGAILQLREA